MGDTDFKWGLDTTGPLLPLSTALFLLYDNTDLLCSVQSGFI